MPKNKIKKRNRNVENFILSGALLHIDLTFGAGQLAAYLSEMELVEIDGTGAVIADIKERRKSSAGVRRNAESFGIVDNDSVSNSPEVAHLQLNGTMRMSGGLSSRGVSDLINEIREADADPNVIGAVVEINSGGGESIAGHALDQAVTAFSKPLVAVANFMASAALSGMLNADQIIMNGPGTEAGSIGSYISLSKGFLEKYRDGVLDIYSRSSPNKNLEFRKLLEGDAGPMEDYATESANLFRSMVRESRNLDPLTAEETLSGGTFYAEDAVQRGLADMVGGMSDAHKFILEKASGAPENDATPEPATNSESVDSTALEAEIIGLQVANNSRA